MMKMLFLFLSHFVNIQVVRNLAEQLFPTYRQKLHFNTDFKMLSRTPLSNGSSANLAPL